MARLQGNLGRQATLEEVATELGVTRERARQIEERALKKCRKALTVRGVSFGDFLDSLDLAPHNTQEQADDY